MNEGCRTLPAHIETMLSERDLQLNKMPVERLLEYYRRNEARVFLDRTLAMQAAASGVPTSGVTVLLSLLFPLVLLSAPLAWYFFSWMFALAAILLAIVVFRASRGLMVTRVRECALNNPQLLDLLISKGTMWFEYVPDAPKNFDPISVPEIEDLNSARQIEALSPAERMFGINGNNTSRSYFGLTSNHDGWHDVLDSAVKKLKAPLSKLFPNETEGFVEAKCELIGYAAAYCAKLWSGAEVPREIWNTLISSIENRISQRIKFAPDLSGYEEHTDGSREFISYSSVYTAHMHDLEKIIDHQYQIEDYEFKELLLVFSPKKYLLTDDVTAEFSQIFERAVFLFSDELIPSLNEDF